MPDDISETASMANTHHIQYIQHVDHKMGIYKRYTTYKHEQRNDTLNTSKHEHIRHDEKSSPYICPRQSTSSKQFVGVNMVLFTDPLALS